MDTKKIEEAVKMIIEAVGEDENREGLQETPTRIAKDVPRNLCRTRADSRRAPV